MIIQCRHCNTPSKVDDAKIPSTAFRIQCGQCQNILTVEPVKPAAASAGPAHYLQSIRLFSALSSEECAIVEGHLKAREYPPHQTVVKEGEAGDSLFFIRSGAVSVRKRDTGTGIDFLLTELKAGACFGEMALLARKPRAASVSTTEATTCLVLEQAAFEALLTSNPKIALALSRVLAERLEESYQHAGIESLNLRKMSFDERVLSLLPLSLTKRHKVMPLGFSNNRLTLAMANTGNQNALEDVRRIIKGVIIEPAAASEADLDRFMTTTLVEVLKKKEDEEKARAQSAESGGAEGGDLAADMAKLVAQTEMIVDTLKSESLYATGKMKNPEPVESVTDLSKSANDAPVVRLANNILALAIKKGASDIHVEPQENEVVVRLRVDGALAQEQVLPKNIQMELISRLKIMSRLDISEKRLPQDGRISVRLDDRPIDFRVSSIPSKWGEKICMRILDKSNTLAGLDKLILNDEALGRVREMIAQPYGIIYVTGPTGSGKTTTLYSGLAELNAPDVNISTAEDPIEYDLARVNQVQAHKEIGLDFARILRAFLRQDPDIILVGETRDKETAQIAVEAALTGHLVFTTLHTNDAAGAFTRLGEMGVEPFLMSSSTVGVIAQRLTRRLCQDCKEPYAPEEAALKYMGLAPDPSLKFFRRRGCQKCASSGFNGRVGVYEVLLMNADLRRLVAAGASPEAVTEAAVRHGMQTLKDYAVWLLRNGWTTMEEVLDVIAVRG